MLQKTKKRNPFLLIIYCILFMLSYDLIITGVWYACYFISKSWTEDNLVWIECISLVIQLIIYLPLYRKKIKNPTSPDVVFSYKEGIIKSIVFAFGISALITLWNVFVYTYLSNLSFVKSSAEFLDSAFGNMEEVSFFATFLSVAILGPIVEELLLRGLIFNTLEKLYPKPWFSIFFSALIFGIWHGNFIQSVYATLMGLIVAYVYYKTRTLIWPILIHIIINGSNTLPPSLDTDFVAVILFCVSFLLLPPMIYFIYRMAKTKSVPPAEAYFIEDE